MRLNFISFHVLVFIKRLKFGARGWLAFVAAIFLVRTPAMATSVVPSLGSYQNGAVLTYHNSNARTGRNTNEMILTPANVSTTNFGLLFNYPVDGKVYGQPLIMTNVAIAAKGVHNVLFAATEHDSVYAFDADSNAGTNAAPLWQVSFINPAAGVTTIPSAELGTPPISPEVGITGTPVVDTASGTIYVEARTKEVAGGVTNYVHRLHALDIRSGAEKFGGPVVIQGSVAGTGDGSVNNVLAFNPLREHNRPGLLLNNGIIYIGYASLADLSPFHGWLFGYNATNLARVAVFNANSNGSEGGIWEGGCGPTTDPAGNIYVSTGNGTFDGPTNYDYGDSLLKLATTNGLQLTDYFTPHNQAAMDTNDVFLGSAGFVVLPDETGSTAHPHLLICSDKQGTVYLVDRDNLTHYQPAGDLIVQEITGKMTKSYCTPAYFNHMVYYIGLRGPLEMFSLSNAVLGSTIVSNTTTSYVPIGATPSLSAYGLTNAIVWALQNDLGASVLHAYDAYSLADLYNSSTVSQNPGPEINFAVPTIVNGKVYVGTATNVSVFGLISPIITNQPQSQIVGAGTNVSFTVGVASAVPSSYQWRKNYVPIAQATNVTLVITNPRAGDAGTYSVVITNTIGVAVSVDATLTVTGTSRATGITMLGRGTNQINFSGTPTFPYYVEWASNLSSSPWFFLSTNTADSNGFWQVIDRQATNPTRFYRSLKQ